MKNISTFKLFALLIFLAQTIASTAQANNEYPGRALYPQVPTISSEDLYKMLDQVIIIDSRSAVEYDTLRIKNAINIPLSLPTENFTKQLQKLRAQDQHSPIIFYCNGHSCMKSYKATRKAMLYAKLDNVYSYDSGIFDWTKQYPEHAELLGQSPVSPQQLISKQELKKHTLPALDFIKQADESTVILDVRDRVQREGFYVFSGFEKSIPMSQKAELIAAIKSAKKKKKPLYIYDAVGKQVRWLQYYLKAQNVTQYYFMEGGAKSYFSIPVNQLMDS